MQENYELDDSKEKQEEDKVLEEIIKIRKQYASDPERAEALINQLTEKAIDERNTRITIAKQERAERDRPFPKFNAYGEPHVSNEMDDLHPHQIDNFGNGRESKFVTDEFYEYLNKLDAENEEPQEDDIDDVININDELAKNNEKLDKKKEKIRASISQENKPEPTKSDGTPFINTKQKGKEFEVEVNQAYPELIPDYTYRADEYKEIKLNKPSVKVYDGGLNIDENYMDSAQSDNKVHSLSGNHPFKNYDVGYIPLDGTAQRDIDNIINILEPNKELLTSDINKIMNTNQNLIGDIHSTEEYINNAKELLDALNKDLETKLIKDLDPRYTQNLPKSLVKDEIAVLLNSNQLGGKEGLYLNTIKDKIIGKPEVSVDEYKDILTKFARIRKINDTSTYDKTNSENRKAYFEQSTALQKTIAILQYRGFDPAFLANVDENSEDISIWAQRIVQKEAYDMNLKYVEDHPIPEDIVSTTKIAIETIFGCGTVENLTPQQLEAYNYKYNNQGELKNIDMALVDEADKIVNGSTINLTNMRQAFWKLNSLEYLHSMTLKYGIGDNNINQLYTAITQTKEFLLKKGIGLEDIEKLSKISNKKDIDASNPEFDKYAEKIILKQEAQRMSKTPIKGAIDKFYTELAISFDAANNKYGADLTTDSFVSAAKTFKKMYDLQTALTEMNSLESVKEVSRNVAKIEKFLLLKGFTPEEIKAIKDPNIYKEDVNGQDGFQKLAEYHWDKYADINKEVAVNINKENVQMDNNINKEVEKTRTRITIDIPENNKLVEEKEQFDLSNVPSTTLQKSNEIENNNLL